MDGKLKKLKIALICRNPFYAKDLNNNPDTSVEFIHIDRPDKARGYLFDGYVMIFDYRELPNLDEILVNVKYRIKS